MSLSAESPQPAPSAPSHEADRFTLRSAEDLVAMAPVVLGFVPAESIVVLTFGSEQPFHARIDLPAADGPPGELDARLDEAADLVLEPARRYGADLLALLVYTDDPRLARRTARLFGRRLDGPEGPDLLEAVRVTPGRYYPLLPGAGRMLREDGVPYDLTAHPLVAQAVLAGRVTLASREELVATLAPDPVAGERIARMLQLTPSLPGDLDVLPLLAEGTWVERTVTEHARAGTVPDDADLVRLVRDLEHGAVRDAAWSWVTRPVARDHVELWRAVVRRCPEEAVNHAAAVLAWAAYQDGCGALAWCAVERSLAADPRTPLARLVGDFLTAAVPPGDAVLGLDWRDSLLPPTVTGLARPRGRGDRRR